MQENNTGAYVGLGLALTAVFSLGAFVGHGAADPAVSVPDYVSGERTVPDALTDDTASVTRTMPDPMGADPAPWEAGWTADTAGTESVIPPCEREDGPDPCHWDAERMGNGHGRSFITDPDGTVTYLDTLTPCEREEAATRNDPCHWDADTMGNGHGRSFITDPDGRVTHLG